MKRIPRFPQGEVTSFALTSRVLRGNTLGDPVERTIYVYLPPTYHRRPHARYPVIYHLAGYFGGAKSALNWKAFEENIPQRVDHLISTKKMGPAVIVLPDCFTSLGGNQYINSKGTGRYQDYIVDEIIPLVEKEIRVLPGKRHRAIEGKSSGGYGALRMCLERPDVFSAMACHSGDMYFDFCYRPDFPLLLDELQKYNGSIPKFLVSYYKKPKTSNNEGMALMVLGMAAHYDPGPRGEIRLPLDVRTGAFDERAWKRWLFHDPIFMVDRLYRNLKKLRLLFMDVGTKDQFRLLYGARILRDKLKKYNVPLVYEEFDDNHSGIDYRLNRSLPLLYRAIK